MTTLFISDLHLDASRPEITALFGDFMRREGRDADALYILGDLFEAWVGDDDPSDTGAYVAQAIRDVADAGVPVHFMHGNRDFLVGEAFAHRSGMSILADPAVVLLYDRPAILSHGDLLCTGDASYQAFRAQTRNAGWQQQFLQQPLEARLAFAAQARAASQAHQGGMKAGDRERFETLTDVAPDAVDAMFAQFGIDTLIHGHTHRPAIHAVTVAGRACRRVVLGDWYEQGSVLRVTPDGMTLDALPRA